jgi:hypothetical protein
MIISWASKAWALSALRVGLGLEDSRASEEKRLRSGRGGG